MTEKGSKWMPDRRVWKKIGWRRGSPLYELMRLPNFWRQVHEVPVGDLQVERVPYGSHPRQYMLLCTLPGVPVCRPPVLYFHGGGWRFGRPEDFLANARLLAEQGHPVILPSHRKLPDYNVWHMREDLALILAKVDTMQGASDLWKAPWIAGGMSSGGNLAALMVFDGELHLETALDGHLFEGVFLLGAPLDLSKMFPSRPLMQYAGKPGSAQFQAANPIGFLQPENIQLPILLLHGDADGLVEFESAVSFAQKLRALGAPQLEFPSLKGVAHLDKAAWSIEEGLIRRLLLDWLEGVSETPDVRKAKK